MAFMPSRFAPAERFAWSTASVSRMIFRVAMPAAAETGDAWNAP